MSIDWKYTAEGQPKHKGVYAVTVTNGSMRYWCKAWWSGKKWQQICEPLDGTVVAFALVEMA